MTDDEAIKAAIAELLHRELTRYHITGSDRHALELLKHFEPYGKMRHFAARRLEQMDG